MDHLFLNSNEAVDSYLVEGTDTVLAESARRISWPDSEGGQVHVVLPPLQLRPDLGPRPSSPCLAASRECSAPPLVRRRQGNEGGRSANQIWVGGCGEGAAHLLVFDCCHRERQRCRPAISPSPLLWLPHCRLPLLGRGHGR
jgi:hypothetical protein